MSSKGSSKSSTRNDVTVNTHTQVQNDINIDLVPLGEILAQSQEQVASTDKDTAKIQLLNAELDRIANSKALSKLDGYLEHAKNGLVLSGIAAAAIYLYKNKSKKRGK